MTGTDFGDRIAKARELTLKIMTNLDDRKGILSDIDHAVKQEIEKDIGQIILDDYMSWGNRDTLCNCDPASQPDDSDRYDHGDNAELALLELLYDIRKAAGDPEGKMMQEELVEKIAQQTTEIAQLESSLETWEQAHNRLRTQVISVNDLMWKWRNEGQHDKADELQDALAKGEK